MVTTDARQDGRRRNLRSARRRISSLLGRRALAGAAFRKNAVRQRAADDCYVEAFQATGNADYARVARETCDYVLREMTDPAGGFYSTQDADSEGEEGKFYVWTPQEIEAVLGSERPPTFCYVYDVSEARQFRRAQYSEFAEADRGCAKLRQVDAKRTPRSAGFARAKLLDVRDRRVRPARDDKVLVAWNGLMIDALAQAAGALDEPRYLEAAIKAADFILREMRQPDGTLLHTWRHGKAKLDAYLDDYAALANALVSLYEATFEERYIDEAVRLVGNYACPVSRQFRRRIFLHRRRSRTIDRAAQRHSR